MQASERRSSAGKAGKRATSSLALAQAIFSKAAEGKRLAESRRRQQKKEVLAANAFRFAGLPFDIQEMVLRFLPAGEIGRACAVCKSWNHIYQGAVASIFAQVVGVARGRSRLMRRAELQLVHRLRNTHEKETAIEMALWAAFNGYNNYVIRLVSDKRGIIDVNTAGSEEWDLATVLHVACRQGNAKLVRALLDLGANPACLTKTKQTPLLLACEYGYPDIVDLLLKRSGRALSVNNQDTAGRTALFTACDKGFVDVVHKLVDWGEMIQQETGEELPILDLNLGTLERGSPLCTACRTGQSKIVRRLLDAQAHVNCTTEDGRTAFFCAVERGALNTTKLLLEKRPPLTMQQMATLLFQASPRDGKEAALERAETEIEVPNVHPGRAGVLIDFASSTGKTPAFVAAERGNVALLRVLMNGDADTNKPTFLNKTPLYAATENGHTEVVKMLLSACTRENVLHQTNFGTTAPFMAQRNGHMAIKRLLDEFCADKLTTEKARKRKSKKKQKSAMDRLITKKEKTVQNAQTQGLAAAALEEDPLSSIAAAAEANDRDVARSKGAVDDIVQGLDALHVAVESAFSRQQQGLPRETLPTEPAMLDTAEASGEPKPAPNLATDAPLQVDESESSASPRAQEEKRGSPYESKYGDVDEAVPECQDGQQSEETNDGNASVPEEDDCERKPSPSGVEVGTLEASAHSVRQSRAAFFEKKFGQGAAAGVAQLGDVHATSSPNQSEEGRQVPKKEKDLLAARKWSKSFISADDDEDDAENVRGKSENATEVGETDLTLAFVRSSLLTFSSVTASSKMTDEIFDKTFAQDKASATQIRAIYDSMKTAQGAANAWDVFVAMTLLTASATVEDKLSFCFGLFDVKSRGHLEIPVARTMLRCCCKAISRIQNAPNKLQGKKDLQTAALELAAYDLKNTSFEADSVDRLQFISWAQESDMGKSIFREVLDRSS